MRTSTAAVALIRRRDDGRTLWLAQWNPKWDCFNFVAGHKHDDETFRQCVIREVGEELELHEGADFRVPEAPAAHVEYTAWSESAQTETAYTMELFDVQLVGNAARTAVDANPDNRWLTEAEIHAQQTGDGQRVSPTMGLLLTKLNAAFQEPHP